MGAHRAVQSQRPLAAWHRKADAHVALPGEALRSNDSECLKDASSSGGLDEQVLWGLASRDRLDKPAWALAVP